MASGICGTDVHIFQGEYLGSYPIIPGHEFAGVIEQVGSAVTRFKIGDRVAVEPNLPCDNCVNCLNNRQNFCLNWQAVGVTRPGGMAQYVSVPEKAVFDIGDLPFEQGAFMEPLSCVLHGLERLDLTVASRVLLLGAGPIGLLLLQGLRLNGAAELVVVDKNPDRAALAQSLGADRSLTSLDEIERDAYDAVVDATGAVAVMGRTLDFARPGGRSCYSGCLRRANDDGGGIPHFPQGADDPFLVHLPAEFLPGAWPVEKQEHPGGGLDLASPAAGGIAAGN